MSCIVRGCKNVWYPGSSVKFHSFPTDPIRRNAWLTKITKKGKFYDSARICSEHFKHEDYDPERPGYLLKNAVPFSAYKLCECCNTSECVNMPSTSQPRSTTVFSNLGIVLPPQMRNFDDENELPIKRRALNDDWVTVNMHTFRKTSAALLPAVGNATGTLSSPAQHIVRKDDEPPVKWPVLKDFNVQANIKTTYEKALVKRNKVLQQQVKRQGHKIKELKSIINVLRNYTSQSEIKNILKGVGNVSKVVAISEIDDVNTVISKKRIVDNSPFVGEVKNVSVEEAPHVEDEFVEEYLDSPAVSPITEAASEVFSWQVSGEHIPVVTGPAEDKQQALDVEVDDLLMYEDSSLRASRPAPKHPLELDKEVEAAPSAADYRCNVCSGPVPGLRYTCVQCVDFDLCGACEAAAAHAHHYVLRVPGDRPYGELQRVLHTLRTLLADALVLHAPAPEDVKEEQPDPIDDPIGDIDPLEDELDPGPSTHEDSSESEEEAPLRARTSDVTRQPADPSTPAACTPVQIPTTNLKRLHTKSPSDMTLDADAPKFKILKLDETALKNVTLKNRNATPIQKVALKTQPISSAQKGAQKVVFKTLPFASKGVKVLPGGKMLYKILTTSKSNVLRDDEKVDEVRVFMPDGSSYLTRSRRGRPPAPRGFALPLAGVSSSQAPTKDPLAGTSTAHINTIRTRQTSSGSLIMQHSKRKAADPGSVPDGSNVPTRVAVPSD